MANYDWMTTKRRAPYFYEVFITKKEVEDEGKKVVIEIGNQYAEECGGSLIDFLMTKDCDFVDPENRFKIILCKETVKSLIGHLQMALDEMES